MSVMTDERVVLDEQTSTDKNEQAHIVLSPEPKKENAHAYVMRARVEGFPVKALCGFTWVPNKQATGLTVCPECKDIYANDPNGFGDRDKMPEE